MKYLSLIILNIAFISTGFICAKSSGNSSPLPENRPADLYFRYVVNGGMMYYGEEIYLCQDSCFYKINDGGSISRVNFKMTPEELDKLYSIFIDNRFDEIKTYEEKVYDRGGESIALGWGKGNHTRVSNSGMTFIKDSWLMEWSACSNSIEKIGKDQLEKQKKNYIINFNSSLFGKEIYLQINRDVVIPKSMLMAERDMDSVITRIVKLAPGKHRGSLTMGKTYNTFVIDADSSKTINFSFVNDSLKYNFTE